MLLDHIVMIEYIDNSILSKMKVIKQKVNLYSNMIYEYYMDAD